MALRMQAGMDIILDFHFSNDWYVLIVCLLVSMNIQKYNTHSLIHFLYNNDTSRGNASQQTRPAAWNGLNFDQLMWTLKKYTKDTLNAFHGASINPIAVQLGNEMAGGILYLGGKIWGSSDTPSQWKNLGYLLQAATDGVFASSVNPAPQIILHTTEGGRYDECQWFFNKLRTESTYND